MTVKEVRQEVIRIIQDSTETELNVSETTHLIKEIGLSSVETLMLVSELEDRFSISIPSAMLRNVWTAGDLCEIVIAKLKSQ